MAVIKNLGLNYAFFLVWLEKHTGVMPGNDGR